MRSRVSLFVVALSVIAWSGSSCTETCEVGEPNPAADRIDFSLVAMASPTTGTVQIVGVVQNNGSGAFDSSTGQQSVQLFEGSVMVAQQAFEDLAVGATVSVSHTRSWDTNNEFPPTYRVLLAYDPDIFIDGNANNDDCRRSDNSLERSGSEINSLFP